MSRPLMPITLTAIVITKNEAHNLADCFASLAFARELIHVNVVVLDSGSTDDTVALAMQLDAKAVVMDDWLGFGRQKNRALDLATGEWVLSIDADERLSPELVAEIQHVLTQDTHSQIADIYDMPRRTSFCGQWIDHCGWAPDRVARLFRRGTARFNENLVHESLQAGDNIHRMGTLKTPLLHFSYPTPNHYWDKLKTYSEAWAKQKFLEGKTTSIGRAVASSVVAFVRSYIIRLGFLDGALGFVVCQMQAEATFYKYFQLYFLNQKKN